MIEKEKEGGGRMGHHHWQHSGVKLLCDYTIHLQEEELTNYPSLLMTERTLVWS